jgi:hypothetical protein
MPSMHHIAIMKPSWKLLPKIISAEKTIESRWYTNRRAPWDRITAGDTVWFKDSGKPITVRARVKDVLQFENMTPKIVGVILKKYGREDGIENRDATEFFERFKDKKYCVLVFLDKSSVVKPFDINKKGYGAMSAWMSVKHVSEIVKT